MAAAQNFVTVSRRPPDIEDYIDMLRRYRSWLIGPMFVGLVCAVVVGFMWPDTYVSQAVMRITPQQISANLVPSVVTMQMQQRLQQMQQEILSRSSLSELIQRPSLDLYRKERARYPMEDIIQDMRNKAIRIQTVEVNRTASAFTISFAYPDRFKAQAVVRELVTKFTEQNVTVQRNNTNLTTQFLNDELKQAKDKMDNLEAQLTQFKNQNMGRLPEQFQANVAQLNTLQMMQSQANEALSRLQQQRYQLETQLQNNNTNLNYYNSLLEDQVTVNGPQQVRNEKLNQLNQKIMTLQSDVAALTEQFTPNHPMVKKAQASLAKYEKLYEEEAKADLEKEAAAPATTAPTTKRVVNQQVAKAVQDLANANNTIKTEMQNLNLQMDEKVKQQAELNRQIAAYQSRVEGSPQLEGQYVALVRELGLAKQTYEDYHRKSEISETAKDLEEHKAGENLEVLDPASDPQAPSEPNRLQIAAMGSGMGLMLGIVLAGAREMKNTSLKNLKDVRAYTNLPVLSSIPLLENALLVRRKRRLLWLAWSSAIIFGSIAMSAAAYYYYFGHAT
uniref:Lipopolysaccharide biosynthesis n=1 Tax=Solibacter usitatus (strain Ellin6076) TaxID=234267 RepID=Q028B9_SOLUE